MIILPPPRRGGVHCRVGLTKGIGNIITGQAGPFHNILTETGLDALADTIFDNATTYCQIGVGDAEPAIDDEELDAFFASTNNLVDSSESTKGLAPFYSQRIKTFRFVAGTFSGQAISEVGFSDQSGSGNLFSRALVLTPFADAIDVPVNENEWLDVAYDFRLYPPYVDAEGEPEDLVGTTLIGANAHDYVLRPCNVSTVSRWSAKNTLGQFVAVSGNYADSYDADSVLREVTSQPTNPSGASATSSNSSITALEYLAGNYYRGIRLNLGPDACNAAGGLVGALRFNTGMGSYQIAFDPPVPKDSGISWNFSLGLGWLSHGSA